MRNKINSFDSIRLIGSLLVLIGHSIIISGQKAPKIGNIEMHTFGVCIFFAISGFLITKSWTSDPSPTRFLQRRALRIFPALLVVATATALVIGPLATTYSLTEYFHYGWTYKYFLFNSALITVWGLPGVFDTLPIAGQVNGSLWTLPIEFMLYLVVPALSFIFVKSPRLFIIFVAAISICIITLKPYFPEIFRFSVFGIDLGRGLALAPYFWIGSAISLLDISTVPERAMNAAMVSSAIIVSSWLVVAPSYPWLTAIAIIPISFLVIMIGLSSHLYSRRLSDMGDLSYGLYLWSFPIQQLIMLYFGGSWVFILAT